MNWGTHWGRRGGGGGLQLVENDGVFHGARSSTTGVRLYGKRTRAEHRSVWTNSSRSKGIYSESTVLSLVHSLS